MRIPSDDSVAAKLRPGLARWMAALVAMAVWIAPLFGVARAESKKPSINDVEAVYLYDFGKFVRWPADTAKGPLAICVAGNADYEQALAKIIAGERIGGRTLSVVHIDHPKEETGCDILFLGSSMQDHPDDFLAAVAGKPTLTVSDMPGFLDHGGMIQFLLVDDRVRFAVNLDSATRCKLSLSSELLKVALRVIGTQPGGGGA